MVSVSSTEMVKKSSASVFEAHSAEGGKDMCLGKCNDSDAGTYMRAGSRDGLQRDR